MVIKTFKGNWKIQMFMQIKDKTEIKDKTGIVDQGQVRVAARIATFDWFMEGTRD